MIKFSRRTPDAPVHVEWARYLETTRHHDFVIGRCGAWRATYFGPWNVGVFETEQAAIDWGNLIKRIMK